MTRVVVRLTEDGLVDRERHLGDRRQVVITITAAGSRLLAADRRRRDEWLSSRLNDLPAEDLKALAGVIPILDQLAGS